MKNSSLILLYNNAEYLPFHLSSGFESKGWEVTLDKRLIGKAAVVVFHLPTLLDVLSEELEKTEGQFWVAWKHSREREWRFNAKPVWGNIFDLYLSYSPQCYWKCATTFGSQLRPYKLMYPLLDEITNWFRKIDFMIIGTQKGGSTALHDYLHHHPSCWGSFFKEPGFFLYPTEYAKGFPFFMEYMWKEYPPFRYSLSDSLLFESTTWYSYWYEVPERLFEYNPHLKFIFLVKNPIDRAYSQYNMLINWRKSQLLHEYELFSDKEQLNILLKKLLDTQNFPFSYWVNQEIEKIRNQENTPIDFFPDFLHRGFYYEQLERYYQFFPVENILVIEHRELKNNRISTLRKIEQFLNIPYVDWNTINLDDKFVSQYNVKLPSDIRNKLKAFFKPYNEKFYKLIKRNFDW